MDIPVEFEKLGNILEAGRYAPSAGNLQDWNFLIITDKEKREAVAKACFEQYWISHAPVIVVVGVTPSKTERYYGESGEMFSICNGAAAVQNMLLTAHAEGLASCWVGAFEKAMLHRVLNISDDVIVTAVLPVGYADEQVPVPPRKILENLTFVDAWGNKVKDLAAYMEWYGEHVQKAAKRTKEFVKDFVRRLQQ